MPVGTVLRDATCGDLWIRVSGLIDPWKVVMAGGDTFTTARTPDDSLVELVGKPTSPEMAELRDRCGAPWILRDGLYHTPTCPDGCSKGVTLEYLDSRWGPLTEETGS